MITNRGREARRHGTMTLDLFSTVSLAWIVMGLVGVVFAIEGLIDSYADLRALEGVTNKDIRFSLVMRDMYTMYFSLAKCIANVAVAFVASSNLDPIVRSTIARSLLLLVNALIVTTLVGTMHSKRQTLRRMIKSMGEHINGPVD